MFCRIMWAVPAQSSFRENTSSPPFKVALNMGFDLALEQKLGRLRNAADIFILSCFSIQPELDLVDLTNASEA